LRKYKQHLQLGVQIDGVGLPDRFQLECSTIQKWRDDPRFKIFSGFFSSAEQTLRKRQFNPAQGSHVFFLT